MKKRTALILLGFVLAAVLLLVPDLARGKSALTRRIVSEGGTDSVTLIILHTNDTHSRLDPLPENSSSYAGRGGILRRDALFRRQRQQAERQGAAVLTVDAGDFCQGTPYYNFFDGQVEVDMMNRLGYQAVTLGNHEFDKGTETLAKALKNASFKVVCSNYDLSASALKALVVPWTVIETGGLRIGLVGACPDLKNLVMPSHREGVVYQPPVAPISRYATMLKEEQHCDLVVCLSHLGHDNSGSSDLSLARESVGVDVIIGGHSHTFLKEPVVCLNSRGEEVIVSQMGRDGVYVGRIELKVKKKR
ncbi:MAG: metallophosphatase [Bacteroidales bacterium]|nr:metallophosphatase [Bacteroidales bacterium]